MSDVGASVLLETSLGDIVIDLYTNDCPQTCQNFIKLCKIYYYNLNAFFNVSKNFLAQTGDPEASGRGGSCVMNLIDDKYPRYFKPEYKPNLKHSDIGTVSMAVSGDNEDGKYAPFGKVVEGFDTLEKLNDVYVDSEGRPFKDVRIRHVVILEDPFEDPVGLKVPDNLPTVPPDSKSGLIRIESDEELNEDQDEIEKEKKRKKQAASASALTLEMVGDLPFAEIRPPENILFVCKLNPITSDEDLELIFSRFGKILSCEVIRDKKTGDSLQYAFIEFDKKQSAEQAYFKMQNVLVDDRRIWVDFSQSVSKLHNQWMKAQELKKGRYLKNQKKNNNDRSLSPRRDDKYGKGREYRSRDNYSRRRDDSSYRRKDDHDYYRRRDDDDYYRRRDDDDYYRRRDDDDHYRRIRYNDYRRRNDDYYSKSRS